MKKLLASASLIVLSSASVFAADLPMNYKAPAPYVAHVFNWTGCYVGVHGGGGVMHDSWTDENGSGGLAGGQLGCNYQDGNWVFGLEGEGYWSGMKSTSASSSSESTSEGIFTFRSANTTQNKYDFSIAARAGIAFDRTLVYGKAGWVWGKFDFLETFTETCPTSAGCIPNPFISTQTGSDTLNGLLLGVGIEHAITNNWTVKLEYNFLKYGSKEISFVECRNDTIPACGLPFTNTYHADKQIFKIGANYLFNMGGGPLVAKY
jgi:outer membrane immunogenic protein